MFGPPFLVLPQKLVVARRAQNKFARKTSFDVFAAHQSRIQTLLNLVVGTMGFGRPVHVGSPDQLAFAVGAHLRLVLVVQCGFLEVPLPSRLEQLNGVDFVTVPPLLCLLRESSSLRLTSCSPSARWCGRHGWLVPLILLPSSLCTGAFGPLRRSSSFRNGLPLPACRCLASFFGGRLTSFLAGCDPISMFSGCGSICSVRCCGSSCRGDSSRTNAAEPCSRDLEGVATLEGVAPSENMDTELTEELESVTDTVAASAGRAGVAVCATGCFPDSCRHSDNTSFMSVRPAMICSWTHCLNVFAKAFLTACSCATWSLSKSGCPANKPMEPPNPWVALQTLIVLITPF